MKLDHLYKLFVSQLKDAYSAENQFLEVLPVFEKQARSEKLKSAIRAHIGETRKQIERLTGIFDGLEYAPGGHRCKAAEGLVKEAKEICDEVNDPSVMDAAIICAAQKIEHYEIATYGCLRSYARILGNDRIVAALEQTLDEEHKADHHLTEMAEQWVNAFAMQQT